MCTAEADSQRPAYPSLAAGAMADEREQLLTVTSHNARVVRVRKGVGLKEGLIYTEVYLPFRPEKFAEFWGLVKLARTTDPTLTEDAAVQSVSTSYPELANLALAPIDTQGEVMLQEDLVQMAHDFLVHSRKIDVYHDKVPRPSVQVVESFLNTEEIESPHFFPGSWVIVLKVQPGTPEWVLVDAGILQAVSFETLVNKMLATVRVTAGGSNAESAGPNA